jgi:hypothetical protein
MARVIGEIKPDWSVVRYETPEDFKYCEEKSGVYELCRGLMALDEEFNPAHTISQIMVLLNSNNPQARIRIYPCITDTPDLEELVSKINPRFINNEWHIFPNYAQMVKKVAKDYSEWLQYTEEKEAYDSEGIWSSTDAGYNLVFPIWRDVERIINKD